MRKLCVCIAWLLFYHPFCDAQTKTIDSLAHRIYAATDDKQRLDAILQLCNESQSLDRDTLDFYSTEAVLLAKKTGDKRQKDLSAIARANTYYRWGWIDSAIAYIDPVIDDNDAGDTKERAIYFSAMRQKALYYGSSGKYAESLELLYKIVQQAEKFKDTLVRATNLNSIGSISLINELPQNTLPIFRQALANLSGEKKFSAARAAIYVNMGEAYRLVQKYDSALYYNDLGMQLFKQTENLNSLGITLQRRSSIYIDQKQYLNAEEVLKQLIGLRKSMGDDKHFVDDNTTLIDFYLATNQVDKAIAYCKSLLITGNIYKANAAKEKPSLFLNQLSHRLQILEELAKCYKQKNDHQNYSQTLEKVMNIKDSINVLRQEEVIEEIRTKYEVQKKENLIIQQKYDLQKKNFLFYGSTALTGIVIIAGILLFRNYRKRNKLRTEKLIEDEKRTAGEAIKNAEEQERKRIAADLHDNIGAYASAIRADVEKIADSGFEKNNESLQNLQQHSQEIINSLRDTIWVLNKEHITITGIGDRIKNYLNKLQPTYSHIKFQMHEDIKNDVRLSSKYALNIFRIVQEAIHNALKHSKASNLNIEICSKENITFTIADDGTGMDTSTNNLTGNGLLNMKIRAKEANMRLDIFSENNKGTRLVLTNTTN